MENNTDQASAPASFADAAKSKPTLTKVVVRFGNDLAPDLGWPSFIARQASMKFENMIYSCLAHKNAMVLYCKNETTADAIAERGFWFGNDHLTAFRPDTFGWPARAGLNAGHP
jgi:hypothetical protein